MTQRDKEYVNYLDYIQSLAKDRDRLAYIATKGASATNKSTAPAEVPYNKYAEYEDAESAAMRFQSILNMSKYRYRYATRDPDEIAPPEYSDARRKIKTAAEVDRIINGDIKIPADVSDVIKNDKFLQKHYRLWVKQNAKAQYSKTVYAKPSEPGPTVSFWGHVIRLLKRIFGIK